VLPADRQGVAAAEFAIVASVVLIFVVAIVDIGASIQQRMVLQQAARAAGIYAQSFPQPTSNILSAAAAALPASWTGTTTTNALMCQGGTVSAGTDCTASCNGGGSGTYLIVQVCKPYTPFLFQTGNCTTASGPGNCTSYVLRLQ
jgi:Flp pilus assembly protein TadG